MQTSPANFECGDAGTFRGRHSSRARSSLWASHDHHGSVALRSPAHASRATEQSPVQPHHSGCSGDWNWRQRRYLFDRERRAASADEFPGPCSRRVPHDRRSQRRRPGRWTCQVRQVQTRDRDPSGRLSVSLRDNELHGRRHPGAGAGARERRLLPPHRRADHSRPHLLGGGGSSSRAPNGRPQRGISGREVWAAIRTSWGERCR